MNYRPTISEINPGNCFTGVSLSNPNFYNERLEAFINKIASLFSSCTFVIGDNIHKYDIEIENSCSSDQAYSEALRYGAKYITELIKYLNPRIINYKILKTSDISKTTIFQDHYIEIYNAFISDIDLRFDIKSMALDYVKKKIEKKKIQIRPTKASKRAISTTPKIIQIC